MRDADCARVVGGWCVFCLWVGRSVVFLLGTLSKSIPRMCLLTAAGMSYCWASKVGGKGERKRGGEEEERERGNERRIES